ncbi:hypothetical protein LTR97_000137 [Elasticomyces elasticus]|uniref:MARVEL domain-containing protein n=1 Tax=Elasticomyces elasticus TaxID=574655 RepID=A0AAN8A5D2_9PEZI|nr:hypothetical protein LTR97_000137 [Elasticomyces elasticus]
MGIVDYIGDKSTSGGLPGALARIFLRFLQLVFAVTIAGLYAVNLQDVKRAHKANEEEGVFIYSRWVFAEVVAILSIITVLARNVLWTALFGLFAKPFIHIPVATYPKSDQPFIRRMQSAVWLDLINMLLWLVTAIYSTFIWFRNRGSGRTLHTGRGQI